MADSLSKEDNLSREKDITKYSREIQKSREINSDFKKNRPLDGSRLNLFKGNTSNLPNTINPYLPDEYKERLSISKHQELIFCIGLPASGKTTWARNYCETQQNYVRINRDDLRLMRGTYWLPKQEDMITDWEVDATAIALINGYNVILDATNLNKKRRLEFVENVKAYIEHRGGYSNFQFIINTKKFDTSVEECIKRDSERTAETGKVGKKVILNMANKYGLKTKYPEYRLQAGLPSAIICDLDGTLATNTTGRGFYDWSRVGEDGIDSIVKGILDAQNMKGIRTIIMSGRDGICRPETKVWLFQHSVPYAELLMRSERDQRKDSIVKKELFDKYIKDEYNILFALDDRNQVVDMWRKELGIKCLQVNYGDF